jgi:hypothetical protein
MLMRDTSHELRSLRKVGPATLKLATPILVLFLFSSIAALTSHLGLSGSLVARMLVAALALGIPVAASVVAVGIRGCIPDHSSGGAGGAALRVSVHGLPVPGRSHASGLRCAAGEMHYPRTIRRVLAEWPLRHGASVNTGNGAGRANRHEPVAPPERPNAFLRASSPCMAEGAVVQ